MKSERNSNIELYRIVVMMTIVAHHYVWHSGILSVAAKDPLTASSIFYTLFGLWGKVGVNCFVMITGYFMCKSNITLRKYLKLLFEVEFYSIAIFVGMILSGYETFSKSALFYAINPIKSISVDFTSGFLCFMLFIPFLNILLNQLNRKQHFRLIGLCLFVYTFWSLIPGFDIQMNYVSWFCVLYFISSFIRLYDYRFKGNSKFWALLSLLCIGLSCISVIGFIALKQYTGYWVFPYMLVNDSNTALAVLTAFCSFNFFVSLKARHNRFINMIASSMFGVLLIHDNASVRHYLWTDWLHIVDSMNGDYYVLNSFLYVLLIMMIGVAVDQIRIRTVEKGLFYLMDK